MVKCVEFELIRCSSYQITRKFVVAIIWAKDCILQNTVKPYEDAIHDTAGYWQYKRLALSKSLPKNKTNINGFFVRVDI